MNDLKDFIDRRAANQVKDKEFYCLQPVVVYKIGDNYYDVIDGQQRLTTIPTSMTKWKSMSSSLTGILKKIPICLRHII